MGVHDLEHRDSLDSKHEDKIDLTQSASKSPDISKEKIGYSIIEKDLEDTHKLKIWEKYTEHDVNQAFYRYTSKEIDKVWKSANKEKLKWLQTELLVELQNTPDMREKLKKIAALKEKMEDITGQVNGENSKSAHTSLESQKDWEQKMQSEQVDKFKEFQKLLSQTSQDTQKKQSQIASQIARDSEPLARIPWGSRDALQQCLKEFP